MNLPMWVVAQGARARTTRLSARRWRSPRSLALTNALGFHTTSVYDAAGRVIAAVDPLLHRTTSVYDKAGQPVAVRDGNDRRTTTIFDPAGRPMAVLDANNHRVTTVFDAVSRRVALVDARANRFSFSFDAANRVRYEQDPLGRRTTFAHDAVGNRSLKLDARGFRTTHIYDASNRPTARRYPDGSRVTMAYDLADNRTLLADKTGRYTTVFDAISRPQRVSSPPGKSLTYSYDAAGRRAHMIDQDGGRFTYAYDLANRYRSVINPQGDRTTFAHDALGRPTSQKNANGTRTSYTHDNANRLTLLGNYKSDNSVISTFADAWDAANNRTSRVEADGARVSWSFDNTYQLTRERRSGAHAYDTTYVYDPTGNREQKIDSGARTTYAYDAANQIRYAHDATGRTTFQFDAAGNQEIDLAPGGGRTTNTWDYDNRRTLVKLADGTRSTFAYNGDGQRVSAVDPTADTRFLWDFENILAELDASGATQAEYTLQPQLYGNLIAQRRLSGGIWTPSQYHFDPLGSTDRLTSAIQSITDEYLYKAFGEQILSGLTTACPYRWCGRVGYTYITTISDTSVRARWYRPFAARWLSQDPSSAPPLSYIYARNRAIHLSDPSGLREIEAHLDGAGGGGGGSIPLPDFTWIWEVFKEAERRRGSRGPGDGSSHHCWAVCKATVIVYGAGGWIPLNFGMTLNVLYFGHIVPIAGNLVETFDASRDWKADMCENNRGWACAMAVTLWSEFVYDCDDCCKTKIVPP